MSMLIYPLCNITECMEVHPYYSSRPITVLSVRSTPEAAFPILKRRFSPTASLNGLYITSRLITNTAYHLLKPTPNRLHQLY